MWCRRCSTPTRPTTTPRSKSPRWEVGIKEKKLKIKKKKPKFWLWWLKGPGAGAGGAATPCLPCRLVLQREKHFHYLKRGLRQLSEAYEVPGTAPASCPGAPLQPLGAALIITGCFPPRIPLSAGPGAGGEVERDPLGHASPHGVPQSCGFWGSVWPSSPPPVPAVSGRQPPLALLLDPAQLGAAGGAHSRRGRL